MTTVVKDQNGDHVAAVSVVEDLVQLTLKDGTLLRLSKDVAKALADQLIKAGSPTAE